MLTKRQNVIETMKGGNPDRFVNQYEAFHIAFHPFLSASPMPVPGGPEVVTPGASPVPGRRASPERSRYIRRTRSSSRISPTGRIT